MALPSGYVKLEYIETTGGQFIDTGFKPNQNTRVVAKIGGAPRTKEQMVFGSRTSTSSADKFMFLATSKQNYRTDFYNNNIELDTSFDFTDVFTVDKNKNKTYFNGTLVATNDSGTFTGKYSVYLFAGNTKGSPSTIKSGTRFYSCQIYDNDVIARNFIPCKNSSGIVGMWDDVNSKFYQNAGSGAFVSGPEIHEGGIFVKVNGVWKQIDNVTVNVR